MGLKECASWASVCRGYDYYKEDKVLEIKQESETTFSSLVKGADNAQYHVYIDIKHPRKSKCDCPHADGRRIVCKHQKVQKLLQVMLRFLKAKKSTEKRF